MRLASKSELLTRRYAEACRLLDQAKATCGASPALNRERRAYAKALGEIGSFHEPDIPPRTASEHYDLGRSYLRSGLTSEAAEEFQRTLRAFPTPRFLAQLLPGALRLSGWDTSRMPQ